MDIWEYEDYIKKVVTDSGMYITYTVLDKDTPLSFSIAKNNLNINLNMIFNILQNKPYSHLSDEQVLNIMTCHELGHIKELRIDNELEDKLKEAVDSNNQDLLNKFLFERELRAWELGKQYVPKELFTEYDDFNKQSLEVYKNLYKY